MINPAFALARTLPGHDAVSPTIHVCGSPIIASRGPTSSKSSSKRKEKSTRLSSLRFTFSREKENFTTGLKRSKRKWRNDPSVVASAMPCNASTRSRKRGRAEPPPQLPVWFGLDIAPALAAFSLPRQPRIHPWLITQIRTSLRFRNRRSLYRGTRSSLQEQLRTRTHTPHLPHFFIFRFSSPANWRFLETFRLPTIFDTLCQKLCCSELHRGIEGVYLFSRMEEFSR